MNLREKFEDLFIPCARNTYTPNFLERMSAGIMLCLVLLSFAAANIHALLWMGSDWMVSTVLPAVIVDLTNEERTGGSLGTLTHSEVLDRAAQMKANDMAKHEYFAHYSPTGVSPWHWFDEASYTFVNAGENLAVHFTDSSDVVDAWMESPTHKANIMNGAFTEIGVGTAQGEYQGFPTIFVVQLFGTPAAPRAPKIVSEVAGVTTEKNQEITLETVTVSDDTPPEATTSLAQVAPATIETRTVAAESSSTRTGTGVENDTTLDETDVQYQNTPNDTQVVPALYSDLATTSRPGVPAVTEEQGSDSTYAVPETNLLERSATQPSVLLQVLYGILACVVVVALALSIIIEWRRQNPLQIAYATGLLVVMALLLHIHIALTSSVTIL